MFGLGAWVRDYACSYIRLCLMYHEPVKAILQIGCADVGGIFHALSWYRSDQTMMSVRPSCTSALSRDASTSHEFTPDVFANQLMN